MSQVENLSFEAFQALLAELLHLDAALLRPEAYFITDLGVDSLRLAEILLYLEELGLEISPDLAWQIQTVGDAYDYYRQHVTSGKSFGLAPLGFARDRQDKQQAAGGRGP